MINRIHITGASGSGTTTLGKAISDKCGYKHFDADDYFWYPTKPPYIRKRPIIDRQLLLQKHISQEKKWVISGSVSGWGDAFMHLFDLVIFLWVPTEIRIRRLKAREEEAFGDSVKPGGNMHQNYQNFLQWAADYDHGDLKMRSKQTHENWLNRLDCPVLRIEGTLPLEKSLEIVADKIGQ